MENFFYDGQHIDNQIEEHFNLQSVLWFTLGTEDYAIKVDNVQTVLDSLEIDKGTDPTEIRKPDKTQSVSDDMLLTPIPNTPKFVLGVINLRGVIIPIIDLKIMFQMPKSETDDRMAVVLKVDNMQVGIAVDRVKEVLDIDYSKMQPPPSSLSGLGAEYVVGIHKHDTNILIIVDIVKVINIAKEMINKYS